MFCFLKLKKKGQNADVNHITLLLVSEQYLLFVNPYPRIMWLTNWLESPSGKDGLDLDWKVTIKWILKKESVQVCNGFIYIKSGICGGNLSTW
jgi:hypothetical protein